MKVQKKLLLIVLVSLVALSSIPRSIQGVDLHADSAASLVEGANEEYLVVFRYDRISNDRVVEEQIRARLCKRTPTEFQTIDVNDLVVTSKDFEFSDREYSINQTELVYLDGIAYLLLAVEEIASTNLVFFIMTSEDNGLTWSNYRFLTNTSTIFTNFNWFDAVKTQNQVFIAYSFRLTSSINRTMRFFVEKFPLLSPSTIEQTSVHYGDDFELFNYDNVVYLVSTDPTGLEPFSQVRLTTVSSNGMLFSGVTALMGAPENRAAYFNPSVTYWENGFFVAAHDRRLDVYDVVQNISFEEYYLWGAKVEDFGPDGDLATEPTVTSIVVVKEDTDGYYRMDPSVTVYLGEIFIAYTVGEGRRFGGGWPEIGFSFSKDGKTWTNDYLGTFSLFLNPGIYFAIATVGLFVLAMPCLYFYNKFRKGK
ncbi:MAG: hypothetical protein KAS63_02960 [Candidatus Heimdallarchaeota archaeon]|nr:hypothetical protein [Candidatus Heimdallarchaeota archaeon]MCK4954296.1 hypothetical protein [Candidatus Heimdallarchaeota archaeon]